MSCLQIRFFVCAVCASAALQPSFVFAADPELPLPIVRVNAAYTAIVEGQGVDVFWSTSNAVGCNATTEKSDWYGLQALAGNTILYPLTTTTYGFKCWNRDDKSVTVSVTITVDKDLSLAFTVSPLHILAGESATISWSVQNGAKCGSSGSWNGSKPTSGTDIVSPVKTATYTLVCTAAGKETTKSITIDVIKPLSPYPFPTIDVAASQRAGVFQIIWKPRNARACFIGISEPQGGIRWVETQGNVDTESGVVPNAGKPYEDIMRCEGEGVSVTRKVHIVRAADGTFALPPTDVRASFTATPPAVRRGETAVFRWTAANAETCVAGGDWSGSQAVSSIVGVPMTIAKHGVYTLECADASGSSLLIALTVLAKDFPAQDFYSIPIVNLFKTPSAEDTPESHRLHWSSTNTVGCSGAGTTTDWISFFPTSGFLLVAPHSSSTYQMACWNEIGTVTVSQTVTLAGSTSTPAEVVSTSTPSSVSTSTPVVVVSSREQTPPITVTVIPDEPPSRPNKQQSAVASTPTVKEWISAKLKKKTKNVSNAELELIPIAVFNLMTGNDSDNDKLSDDFEEAIGTNPSNPDTDGDGYLDGEEIINGYSPLAGKRARYPINSKRSRVLAGKLLQSAQGRPGLWYVNRYDAKRYLLLSDGDSAPARLKPTRKKWYTR